METGRIVLAVLSRTLPNDEKMKKDYLRI